MSKSRSLMTLVMLTIFVVMVGLAVQFSPQARFMPMVVGIPGIVLCLVQLWLDMRKPPAIVKEQGMAHANQFEEAQATISGMVGQQVQFDMAKEQLAVIVDEPPREGERQRELGLWASLIGLVLGVVVLGFWPTIPVFIALFLRFFAKKGWQFSLGLALVGTIVLFLIFEKGLGIALHGGLLTEQVLEYWKDS